MQKVFSPKIRMTVAEYIAFVNDLSYEALFNQYLVQKRRLIAKRPTTDERRALYHLSERLFEEIETLDSPHANDALAAVLVEEMVCLRAGSWDAEENESKPSMGWHQ